MSDYWREKSLNAQKEYVASNIVQKCLKKLWFDTVLIHCEEANSRDLEKRFTVGTFRPEKDYFALKIEGDRMNVMGLDGQQLDSMVVDNTLVPHWDYMSRYENEAYNEMRPIMDMIKKWFDHFHSATMGPAEGSALVWHAINKLSSALETLIEKNRF